tara:strand:+ start:496 stop:1416 length:921 start_codon:yes stop_codon:yes gene_type:complete
MEEEIQGKYLGYLDSIKQLLDDIRAGDVQGIPEQKLADLDERYAAAEQAFTEGIGAFEPFVQTGQETIGGGVSSIGTGQDVLKEAADVYRGLGTAPTTEQIQPFINPYQDAVRDEINRAYDIAANEAAAGSVAAGTFGGGREGVLRAELEKNRAGALAQAQAQAFGQGLQNYLASQSASAGGLGNIAGQFGQFGTQLGQLGAGQAGLGFDVQRAGLTDIGTLLDFANLQQQQTQRGFDIDYANQAAGYQQPFTELGFLGSAFGYAPSIPQVASAGGAGASPLQQIAGYGIAGLGALSGFGGGGLFG